MNEELLTLLVKELLSNKKESKTDKSNNDSIIGKYVIVRAYGHGVSCGILEERYDQYSRLRNARQIWKWDQSEKTGFTLMELATHGIEDGKLSCPSPFPIEIMQTISIIPVSDEAKKKFVDYPNYEG